MKLYAISQSEGITEFNFSDDTTFEEAISLARALVSDLVGGMMTEEEIAVYRQTRESLKHVPACMPFVKAAFLGWSKVKKSDPKLSLLQLTEKKLTTRNKKLSQGT